MNQITERLGQIDANQSSQVPGGRGTIMQYYPTVLYGVRCILMLDLFQTNSMDLL